MKLLIQIMILCTISACCKQAKPYTYCTLEKPLEQLHILKNIITEVENEGAAIEIKHWKYEYLVYFTIFYTSQKKVFVYDCVGNELCNYNDDNSDACEETFANVGNFIEWTLLYKTK
ncbi:MAG: hypothetical protein ACPGVH_07895 [Chitinophagales bacterium]